jgi:feruloyl esterase
MVPGMAHCAGGVGPDRNDAVTAVIDWVEKGKAPDTLIASKVTDGKVVRTRPLCAYPQVARYSGSGSIDDAAKDVPACSAGADGTDCLTAPQAAAINRIYGGPTSKGKPFMSGFLPGSEAVTVAANGASSSGWVGAIVPAQPGAKPADFNLAEGILRYLVLDPPQANWDATAFDFDNAASLVARWSKLADAKQADLSAFRKSGGKLIMTYGWADQILQPMMGVNYYESVRATHGESTDEFARLFMMPGVTHCSGGVGPDQVDAVTAVIDWVETNRAPDSLLASKVSDGEVVRTRPLCPYPQVARYRGQGSIDDAASFRCVAP